MGDLDGLLAAGLISQAEYDEQTAALSAGTGGGQDASRAIRSPTPTGDGMRMEEVGGARPDGRAALAPASLAPAGSLPPLHRLLVACGRL